MKNFKQLFVSTAIAALSMTALTQQAHAQINAVVSETAIPSSSVVGVINSGNDIAKSQSTGQNISVMVWDGGNAQMAWEDSASGLSGSFNLQGTAMGWTINDPDIAITHDGLCAAVVYERANEIYVEGYEFDPGLPGMVFVSGPTQVSTGTGTSSHPNIDSGAQHIGAIVWIEDASAPTASVMTRGIEICGPALYPTADISINYTGLNIDSAEPDVTVYEEPSGAQYFIYTYVDLSSGGNIYDLIYQIEDVNAILSGWSATIHRNSGATMQFFGAGETIRNPRIASHYKTGFGVMDAATIVYTVTSGVGAGASYNTWSYNLTGGAFNLNSFFPSTNNCTNQKPAICWTDDKHYVAAWEYNGNCGLNNTGTDILSLKLDAVGTPTTLNHLNFQWVNSVKMDEQTVISLASRYSKNAQILSSYHEVLMGVSTMKHKRTNSTAPIFFREAEVTEALDAIYPNPATDELYVNYENMTAVNLYNASGQLVKAYNKSDLKGIGLLKIELTALPVGIYMLKTNTETESFTEKLIVQ